MAVQGQAVPSWSIAHLLPDPTVAHTNKALVNSQPLLRS